MYCQWVFNNVAWICSTQLYTYTHTLHFPGEPGLTGCPLILLLHLFLDCASFWDRPKLSMSFLTQSYQVFFGRPHCLIPSTSHVIQRLTQSLSSFRSTCPNHLSLLFMIIKLTGSNPKAYFTLMRIFAANIRGKRLVPTFTIVRSHWRE